MFFTLRNLFQWFLVILVSSFTIVPGFFLSLFSKNLGFWFFHKWAEYFLKIFQIALQIDDRNGNDYGSSGHLFVDLNQDSLLQTVIYIKAVPRNVGLMNIEFALIPFVGWSFWSLGGRVIIRQWPSQAKRVVNSFVSVLAKESNVWSTLEGYRSKDGRLLPYKKGPVILAIQAQAKIVPIFFEGTGKAMPYGEWRIRPGTIKVTRHKKIDTVGMTLEDRDKVLTQLRSLAESEIERSKNES
jgi:1-acyl-sn-glycerol-3-phosphate acyltransferase